MDDKLTFRRNQDGEHTYRRWVDEIFNEVRSYKCPTSIGLDLHKATVAVAVARAGREAPESRSEIANKAQTVAKLVERLNQQPAFLTGRHGGVINCCGD
jgi:hypothetical protein